MRSVDIFCLLEIFTIRKIKLYDSRIIKDFRDTVVCGLKSTSCYDEFMNGLYSFAVFASEPKLSQIMFQFIKYIKFVYKIWLGKF